VFACCVCFQEKGGGVIHPVNGNYMLLSPHLISLLILITFIDWSLSCSEQGVALSLYHMERRDGFSPPSLYW